MWGRVSRLGTRSRAAATVVGSKLKVLEVLLVCCLGEVKLPKPGGHRKQRGGGRSTSGGGRSARVRGMKGPRARDNTRGGERQCVCACVFSCICAFIEMSACVCAHACMRAGSVRGGFIAVVPGIVCCPILLLPEAGRRLALCVVDFFKRVGKNVRARQPDPGVLH